MGTLSGVLIGSLAVAVAASLAQQTAGTISGIVTDGSGNAVAKADVFIQSLDESRLAAKRLRRDTVADATGKFVLANVPWGAYSIHAYKQAEGYADGSMEFYSNGEKRPVTVAPGSASLDVTLHVGPKAGRIMRLSVTNAVSGKTVEGATVKLSRGSFGADGRVTYSWAISTSAVFLPPLLVPAQVPVKLKLSAPGYADWYFPGTADPGAVVPLIMEPGEERSFDIALTPLAK